MEFLTASEAADYLPPPIAGGSQAKDARADGLPKSALPLIGNESLHRSEATRQEQTSDMGRFFAGSGRKGRGGHDALSVVMTNSDGLIRSLADDCPKPDFPDTRVA